MKVTAIESRCFQCAKFPQKRGKMPFPMDLQQLKCFQLQGGEAPLTPHRGLCALDPRWGHSPQTPIIGSRSCARHVAPLN